MLHLVYTKSFLYSSASWAISSKVLSFLSLSKSSFNSFSFSSICTTNIKDQKAESLVVSIWCITYNYYEFLLTASYISSFLSKSPPFRGMMWMCTWGTVCPACGPSYSTKEHQEVKKQPGTAKDIKKNTRHRISWQEPNKCMDNSDINYTPT